MMLLYRVLLKYTAHYMGLFCVHIHRKSLPKNVGFVGSLFHFSLEGQGCNDKRPKPCYCA